MGQSSGRSNIAQPALLAAYGCRDDSRLKHADTNVYPELDINLAKM